MKQKLVLVQPNTISPQRTDSVAQKAVPKTSAEFEDKVSIRPSGYVGITELAGYYGVSKSSIYDLIKSDPSFPFKNVGLKKRYVVNVDEFEHWLANRTTKEKAETFKIPTGADLLERFKK